MVVDIITKKLAIILVFLCFISIARAESFNITVKNINNVVSPLQEAEFNLTIYNNQNFKDIYRLAFNDLRFSPSTLYLPHYTTGIEIRPFQEKTVVILLKPVKNILIGKYNIEMLVQSKKTNLKKKAIVEIDISEDLYYSSDIGIELVVENIDPSKVNSINVLLTNNNPLRLKNLLIELESNLIKKHATVDLEPSTTKMVEFSVELDRSTKPQQDKLTVMVSKNNTLLVSLTKDIEIGSYTTFEKRSKIIQRFLGVTEEITLTNKGNVQETKPVKIKTSIWDKIFTRTNPKAEVVEEDGKTYFKWDMSLNPGETKTIILTKSYLPLFIIIVVIAFGIVLFFLLRSPIVVMKEAQDVKIEHGGISDMKVIITVRNRTNREIKDVRVVEKISHLVNLEKKEQLGSLKPAKVYNYTGGKVVSWKLAALEPKEERIFSYKIRSKLRIIGGLVIKPAVVEFSTPRGKQKVISNSIHIRGISEAIE